jgi:hypothetical protein
MRNSDGDIGVGNHIGEIGHIQPDGDPTLRTKTRNQCFCEATAQLCPWGDIVS